MAEQQHLDRLAQTSRMSFSGRLFNLLVTNVPGPQVRLAVLGRKPSEIVPIPFLAGERALAKSGASPA